MSTTTIHAGELIHVDHSTTRRLGNWTTADRVHVRARTGSVMLDLRSTGLPEDVEVHVELDRATVKLLVPEEAVVDQWGLSWTGRGKVKDAEAEASPDSDGSARRRIRLTGTAHNSEFRVNRGGLAILFAMCTREGFADLRESHKTGRQSALVDPQA
jgi:hypothetical protein